MMSKDQVAFLPFGDDVVGELTVKEIDG